MAVAGPMARLKAALSAAAASSPPSLAPARPSPAAAHGTASSSDMVVLQEGVQQHLRRVHEAKSQLRHKRGEGSSSLRHHHHRQHQGDEPHQSPTAGPDNVPAENLWELRRRFKVLARHQHLRKREGRLLDTEELGVVGQHLQAVYSSPLPKPTNDEYPAAQTIGRCNYDDFGRLKLQVPEAARRYFDWEHFLEVRHWFSVRGKGMEGQAKECVRRLFASACLSREKCYRIDPRRPAVSPLSKMKLATT